MRGLEYPLFIGGNSSCFITFYILPLTIKVVVLTAKQVTFTFCSCIQGWKFWFFLPKFRVLGVSETKKGGKMSTEEISVNFAKFRRNFLFFLFISAIFRRFFEKIGALHLLLIRRLPTSPHWFELVHFSQLISTFFKSWMN